VLVHGYAAASGTIVATWSVGGGGGPTALQNGVGQNYSVATGATKAYTIAVPANATSLSVTITGSGDCDLYVKRLAINWPADQGAHNEAEFKAPYIGGSAESVSFTNPAQATWNVLLHGYSGNPAGTIVANWEVGSTPTWHYVGFVRETPHN
jgi:serine protease